MSRNHVIHFAPDPEPGNSGRGAGPANPTAGELPSFFPGADLGASMGGGSDDDGGAGDEDGDGGGDDPDPAAGDDDEPAAEDLAGDDDEPAPRKAQKTITINGRKFDIAKMSAAEVEGLIELNAEMKAQKIALDRAAEQPGGKKGEDEDDFLASLGLGGSPKRDKNSSKEKNAEGEDEEPAPALKPPSSAAFAKAKKAFIEEMNEENLEPLLAAHGAQVRAEIEAGIDKRVAAQLAKVFGPLAKAGLGKILKNAPALLDSIEQAREAARPQRAAAFVRQYAAQFKLDTGRDLDEKTQDAIVEDFLDAADNAGVRAKLGDLFAKDNAENRNTILRHIRASLGKGGNGGRSRIPLGRGGASVGRGNDAPPKRANGPTAEGRRAWLNA